MKQHLTFVLAVVAVILNATVSSAQNSEKTFPTLKQNGRIAVVAHRGFWNCEAAGFSENSIAALKAAQDNGFWGCECDIHITADDVVIVNHNNDIEGRMICDSRYSDFDGNLLPNGEKRPTLEAYLDNVYPDHRTVIVIEFKSQKDEGREDLLIDKTMELLRAKGLFDPQAVAFISFSKHICLRLAKEYPQFVNQYLSGDLDPAALEADGINGIDYHYNKFVEKPQLVQEAHARNMSVNVWTVNDKEMIDRMISLGVDAITTNAPLLVRQCLGDREYKTPTADKSAGTECTDCCGQCN